MGNFSFYYGDDENIINKLRISSSEIWNQVKVLTKDRFTLCIPADDMNFSFVETEQLIGAISGYVRFNDMPYNSDNKIKYIIDSNKRLLGSLLKEKFWPLPNDIVSNFSAVSYLTDQNSMVICNDFTGNPLYYRKLSSGILGGTSLTIIGLSHHAEVDKTGLLQRITPSYYNYGRRTLLKNVNRLLPGEWKSFGPNYDSIETKFDHSLYAKPILTNISDVVEKIIRDIENNINIISRGYDNAEIALSGGWDSRLMLPAVSKLKMPVKSITYGNEQIYESKIAKKCSDKFDIPIEFFPIENSMFPPIRELSELVLSSEFASFLVWHNVVKTKSDEKKHILFFGDLYDTLDGRNFISIHTRELRKKLFIKRIFGYKNKFYTSDKENLNNWKSNNNLNIINDLKSNYNILSEQIIKDSDINNIIDETISDLNLTYEYIEKSPPPFSIQYDEIFRWFHYSRSFQSMQTLLLRNAYQLPFSPLNSLNMLRYTSTIHPSLKINRKLIDTIIRVPQYNKIIDIPSPTIPFIGNNNPTIVKEMIWAARHYLDKYYIKKMMKEKNNNRQERFISNLEFGPEYRRKETLPNVNNWFSGRWINSEKIIDKCQDIIDFKAWPVSNQEIVIPANISLILDGIFK